MTIESAMPVVFYGEGIKVEEGATLTLRNTKLYFHDGAGLQVKGRVVAENCLFRGDRLDHMFDYLPYDRVSGQWAGITIKARADGCTFTDCEIRSAYNGIMADSTSISMTNTIVHNSKGYCLYAHDSEVTDADAFDTIIWEKTSDAVQGTGHFVTIDETNFIYDFQLKEESPCVELGIGWTN